MLFLNKALRAKLKFLINNQDMWKGEISFPFRGDIGKLPVSSQKLTKVLKQTNKQTNTKKAQNNLLGLFHFQMTETQIKVVKNKKETLLAHLTEMSKGYGFRYSWI